MSVNPVSRVQVVIAGAGPVGSVAAYRLAQAGIDVLLLESRDELPEDMRASTFHPPTLEMMAELGLLDDLEAVGLRAPVYQYRNRATGEVIAFDMGEIADVSPHPYRLQCEQFKLTRLIAAKLEGHPHGRVMFNRKVVHFEQDEGGVTVNIETPVGLETVRADYLIAADGANSLVRKWLGVAFSGFTYPEKFLTLSTAQPLEPFFDDLAGVNYVADAEEWCVLLKVPDFWRVLVPAREDVPDAVLTADAKKTAVFDGLTGGAGAQILTHHRTIYKVHQRVADQYAHGRVLLTGDAAHLNNPLGGFGMNSGVHDAWNLTDKLRQILLEGQAAQPLLARYDRQRRTVMHEFVQAQTIKNKKAMEASQADNRTRHQAELHAIAANPDARRQHILTQAMYPSRQREAQIL
ncbi:FAD-dependent oxidoreductase [Caulobacter sp.]|uniref:FAD-dependent oxidoreductase n=1 Tax=Caulobacter sp. TaxID=78 RepID=UPI003BABF723